VKNHPRLFIFRFNSKNSSSSYTPFHYLPKLNNFLLATEYHIAFDSLTIKSDMIFRLSEIRRKTELVLFQR